LTSEQPLAHSLVDVPLVIGALLPRQHSPQELAKHARVDLEQASELGATQPRALHAQQDAPGELLRVDRLALVQRVQRVPSLARSARARSQNLRPACLARSGPLVHLAVQEPALGLALLPRSRRRQERVGERLLAAEEIATERSPAHFLTLENLDHSLCHLGRVQMLTGRLGRFSFNF
jgi:hypothetical protein